MKGKNQMKLRSHKRIKAGILIVIIMALLPIGMGCEKLADSAMRSIGSAINKVDSLGDYGLIFVQHDNLEWMKEMVEDHGLDVNKKVLYTGKMKKCSPLYLVNHDYESIPFSEYLLEKGADPNIAYGDTLILSQIDDFDLVKVFVEHGADINLQDSMGDSAVDYADFKTLRYYIENGAIISMNSLNRIHDSEIYIDIYEEARIFFGAAAKQGLRYSEDPIFEAAVLGETERFIELYNKPEDGMDSEDDAGNPQGKTNPNLPYYVAASCGHEALELLIQNGCPPDFQNTGKGELLLIAAASGNVDVIEYLIDQGVNLNFNTYDSEYIDPLNIAISNGYRDAAKVLLDSGAIRDNADRYTPTSAIEDAAKNGDTKMLDILQDHGYPFDENSFYAGLSYAVEYKQIEVVNYFLKKGADPNYVDNSNGDKSPLLEICGRFGTAEIAAALCKYGATVETADSDALADAAEKNNLEVAEYLLEQGMDIKAERIIEGSNYSITPFEIALNKGYLDMVKLLVEHGADITDEKDSYVVGEGGGSTRILKYLLDQGADINMQDDEGTTSLMTAVYSHGANIEDKRTADFAKPALGSIKLLLEMGADTSIKDNKGNTALDIARANKDKEVIKLLEGR